MLLADLNTAPYENGDPYELTTVNGRLFFGGCHYLYQCELWVLTFNNTVYLPLIIK